MNNVLELPVAIWPKLTDLCQREQKHAADARALWPAIGAYMARLRSDYKSDNELGAALVLHGIEYNSHDRAAFIWMGSLAPAALEDALARCERRSPKHFRLEVESWSDNYFERPVCPIGQTAAEIPVEPELAENSALADKSMTTPIHSDEKTEPPVGKHSWDARSKLFVLGEDGRLIQSLIKGKSAAQAIHPLLTKHRKFLLFVAGEIRNERLPAPTPFDSHVFHARRLLPSLDQSFAAEMIFYHRDEDKPRVRNIALFMEHFDLMLQAVEKNWTHAEFIRATKGTLPVVKATSAEEVWKQRPTALPVLVGALPKTASLADGTELKPEPIIVCERVLFPSETFKELTYAEAYVHAHDCLQLVQEMNTHSVGALGMHLAHRGLWLGRHHKELGSFLNSIGIAIRAKGEQIDRALWFTLEPFHNRVTDKKDRT